MIIEWIIIALFVFVGLTYLKLEHHMNKIKIAVIIIIGFMLYFSIMSHFNSSQIDLTSPKGIVNGVYLYVGWIGQTASSLWDIGVDTTHMVGNAIKINKTAEDKQKR